MKIVIVGSGTAGLVSSLYLKTLFPLYDITIVSSPKIPIVGVGEGSTEHWRSFQDFCGIDLLEMLRETDATHKIGIRFENWTKHTPDYFHSVAQGRALYRKGFLASYAYAHSKNLLLTNVYSSPGIPNNKITLSDNPHQLIFQYHFDTFKLNTYLIKKNLERKVKIVEGEVLNIVKDNNNGFIKKINLKNGKSLKADFFIDASGFHRVLISEMEDQSFVDYNEYLPCDSAIAFAAERESNGQIRPYTRAIASSAGWIWEIPTQNRRGCGYVFSSAHMTVDQAVAEVSSHHKKERVPDRIINFRSGYYKKSWQKNCVAVGLAFGFVEPLEATSIGSTIQQISLLGSYLPVFNDKSKQVFIEYHRVIDSIMENILSMISMHYMSDRKDSLMWIDQAGMKKPDLLLSLIDIWAERMPEQQDIPTTGFELFSHLHFWHVAQGMGLLDPLIAKKQINAHQAHDYISKWYNLVQEERKASQLIDHAESLRSLHVSG